MGSAVLGANLTAVPAARRSMLAAVSASEGTPPVPQGPDLTEVVRTKAVGLGAGAWFDGLPDLVAELSDEWGLTPGETYAGGTEAHVVAVTTADGTPAVLKLLIPRDGRESRDEITALTLAGGQGCVRLLRADPDRHALLLARLGRPMVDLGLPLARRLKLLSDAAQRVWRPVPGADLPTGAEKARWLADFVPTTWEELGRPCSEAAVDHALRCANSRLAAHDDERAVLVHGDVHQWNALETVPGDPEAGFTLVDPDGLRAEPECDLGILMREDPVELLAGDPHQRSRWLAARCGCDEVAIWEWGAVERVATGLLAVKVGLRPAGDEMLATAEHAARW